VTVGVFSKCDHLLLINSAAVIVYTMILRYRDKMRGSGELCASGGAV
jgi:hypothetical protein